VKVGASRQPDMRIGAQHTLRTGEGRREPVIRVLVSKPTTLFRSIEQAICRAAINASVGRMTDGPGHGGPRETMYEPIGGLVEEALLAADAGRSRKFASLLKEISVMADSILAQKIQSQKRRGVKRLIGEMGIGDVRFIPGEVAMPRRVVSHLRSINNGMKFETFPHNCGLNIYRVA
jgi:hypothetical protein